MTLIREGMCQTEPLGVHPTHGIPVIPAFARMTVKHFSKRLTCVRDKLHRISPKNAACEMNAMQRPTLSVKIAIMALRGFLIALLCVCGRGAVEASDLRRDALEALRNGDAEKAAAVFSEAINASPDDHQSYNDRGVAHKRLGRIDDAMRDYAKALELRPGFAQALNNMGVALTEKGDYDAAIAAFTEALASNELKSKALTNRGYAKAKRGGHDAAVEDYREALSLPNPDQRAFAFMGDSLMELEEREKALKMYRLALGVVKDQELLPRLKTRIEELEKASKSTQTEEPSQKACAAKSVDDAGEGASLTASFRPEPRVIVRADRGRPAKREAPEPNPQRPNFPPTLWSRPRKVVVADLEGYGALEKASKGRVIAALSPEADAAYKAAMEYVEKNELHKALVRCEDALQIARRNRNGVGEAWLRFEVGRIHADLGEHPKAVGHFERALSFFLKARSVDEGILVMVDLSLSSHSAGMKDRASIFVLKAREEAAVAGHAALAEDLAELSGLSTAKGERKKAAAKEARALASVKEKGKEKTKDKKPAEAKLIEAEPKPVAVQEDPAARTLVIGTAPEPSPKSDATPPPDAAPARAVAPSGDAAPVPAAAPVSSAPPEKPVSPVAQAPDPSPRKADDAAPIPAATPASSGPPEKPAPPVAPSARKDPVEELRRLKEAGDEKGMIPILEDLAQRYRKAGDCRTTLHSLNASLAFREKYSVKEGMDSVLLARGRASECMGFFAAALEDYGRVLAMARAAGDASRVGAVMRSIANGALKTNVDALEVARVLDNLGAARLRGDEAGIANATAEAARFYRKAGMLPDAVNYFDRASASLVMEKSDALEEMGEKEKADQGRSTAVETFKKLDHARYLNLLGKLRESMTPTQSAPPVTSSDSGR